MGFELFITIVVTGTMDFWHFVACWILDYQCESVISVSLQSCDEDRFSSPSVDWPCQSATCRVPVLR